MVTEIIAIFEILVVGNLILNRVLVGCPIGNLHLYVLVGLSRDRRHSVGSTFHIILVVEDCYSRWVQLTANLVAGNCKFIARHLVCIFSFSQIVVDVVHIVRARMPIRIADNQYRTMLTAEEATSIRVPSGL